MRRRSVIRLTSLSAALVVTCCAAAWAATAVWEVARRTLDQAEPIDTYIWTEEGAWFGGLSSLEVSANGMGFVAITDRAHLVAGRFWRDAGQITSIEMLRNERLKDKDGAPVSHRLEDSEGLAFGPDDTFYVSFEGPPRILEISPSGVVEIPGPTKPADFHHNGSFEALARAEDGRLITITESAPLRPGVDRVWQWSKQGGWQGLGDYPEQDGFLPVGADFGPNGALYVLERKFSGIGFRSRLRRFELTETGLAQGDILMSSALAQYDNLEGLSIWRDDGGALRATMIADDNFFWLLRTEVVEVRLPD